MGLIQAGHLGHLILPSAFCAGLLAVAVEGARRSGCLKRCLTRNAGAPETLDVRLGGELAVKLQDSLEGRSQDCFVCHGACATHRIGKGEYFDNSAYQTNLSP